MSSSSNIAATEARCCSPSGSSRALVTRTLLVAEQGPDSLDGLEILVMTQRERAAAMREGLVHGQVEAVVALLHLRPVQRARAALGAHPPAARALPRRVLCPLLEEQQVDPRV